MQPNTLHQQAGAQSCVSAATVGRGAPPIESVALPRDVLALEKQFVTASKLAGVRPEPGSEPKLVAAYVEDKNRMIELGEAWRAFTDDTLTYSVYPDGDDKGCEGELMRMGLQEIRKHKPLFSYQVSEPISWGLVGQSPIRIKAELGRSLLADFSALLKGMWQHAEALRAANLIGDIVQHPRKPQVGIYTFMRLVVRQQRVGSRSTEQLQERKFVDKNRLETVRVTKTVHTSELSMIFEQHEHIYQGRDYPLPAHEVAQPKRVAEFIRRIPKPLWPIVRVAAGPLLRESVKRSSKFVKQAEKVDVVEEVIRTGQLFSPTIAIADKSFLGWSDHDVARDRRSLLSRLRAV